MTAYSLLIGIFLLFPTPTVKIGGGKSTKTVKELFPPKKLFLKNISIFFITKVKILMKNFGKKMQTVSQLSKRFAK